LTASRQIAGLVVECVRGDIINQPDVDAIVNAANAHLAPGGGVAGAIHRAAGAGLYDECKPLAPIRTGEAVITSGHDLPNPWCIHVLGPVYAQSADPSGELASCYRNAMARAEERSLVSLATPAVSTGIFGYPVAQAADVAMRTVGAEAPALQSVKLVRFVLWDASDFDVHTRALEALA
jgi:O-acetyl-ADP-ribose deacetylase (regulator of RNase III)